MIQSETIAKCKHISIILMSHSLNTNEVSLSFIIIVRDRKEQFYGQIIT